MSRNSFLAILLCLVLAGQAGAQVPSPSGEPSLAPASSNDEQSDLVAPLVVRAGDTGGPAWWRVSDGDSQVWVMGVPDWLPQGAKFDERKLIKRLTGAVALTTEQNVRILGQGAYPGDPASPTLVLAPDHQGYACFGKPDDHQLNRFCDYYFRSQPQQTAYPQLPSIGPDNPVPAVGMIQQLPPDLVADFRRLDSQYRLNWDWSVTGVGGRDADGGHGLQIQLPWNQFDRVGRNVLFGKGNLEHNSAVDEAIRIAKGGKVPVQKIAFGAQEATGIKRDYMAVQPLPLRQACMRQVMTALDKADDNVALAKTWADGDYQYGLRHMQTLDLCPLPAVDPYVWGRLVIERFAAVRDLLQKPGTSVALLWLDPLLVKGGVLDLLQSAGFKVETPDQL